MVILDLKTQNLTTFQNIFTEDTNRFMKVRRDSTFGVWTRFPNILSKNEVFDSWIWIDFQNFLYNKALRFCLEGSGIFLNLNSSRYKELEMSQGLVFKSILYILRGKESSESPKQTSGQGFRTYFRKMNVWFHGFGSIFKTFYITRRCASIWRGPGFF